MLVNLSASDTITSVFRRVVSKYGSATAIAHTGGDLSYDELDRQSDDMAARIVATGVGAGDCVGVAAAQDLPTIVSLLAILKVGAGYVPLPGYYPADRLRQIVTESGLRVVVGQVPALADAPLTWIDTDSAAPDAARPVLAEVDAEALAYVMYTSGSTGVPKGVAVPHRAILRLVVGQDFMRLGPDERILQNSPIAFDAATLEIWGALLNGGTLVIPGDATQSLRGLGEVVARERITTLWLTAGLFHAMADERPGDFAPLRQLLTGGDVVSPAKVARVMAACPGLTIINGYGPTENTTFTCCHHITRDEVEAGQPLPIGRPIRGTAVHIVGEDLTPVAEGETGELCTSGLGLALGYLNRPDLTAEKFVSAPWDPDLRLYRTGDLARRDAAGLIHYLGRIDTQVKIRGYRVELGEIEAALESHPGVGQAAVVALPGKDGADKTLIGYYTAPAPVMGLSEHLAARLPEYQVPGRLVALDALPINANGKVDRKALEAKGLPKAAGSKRSARGADRATEDIIAKAMAEALGQDDVERTVNFFDLGASSLHVARVHERVQTALDRSFPISDFFLYSTVASLAAHLSGVGRPDTAGARAAKTAAEVGEGLIAIVGLAGRFPGAKSADELWQAIMEGRELISHFSEDELDIDPSRDDPDAPYVRARGVMPEADMFDARHFGIPPREAERMDPQHRILLEVAQTALDNAGVDPERFPGRIGIFAGSSQNSYLLNNLLSPPGASRALAAGYPVKDFATLFGNDKDFIATRVAYKLNLRGPAMTVLCACSTSLVAVAQGCDALQRGTADMVLAGGVSVTFPSKRPYLYTPDGMASDDGHCRTFDAAATGTVFGDGAGLVVLRRLEDALAAGDEVIAVIRGYSINNDGSDKAGYAAPSIRAQADVIKAAHQAAGVKPAEIGYVEMHGTGTPLGDPIEFAALTEAFGQTGGKTALGSAKTYVGHLDIAAGVTGLIKTALTLKNGVIPPLLHFKSPNPRIDFVGSPFYPVTDMTAWTRGAVPRRAGVSAFGVGGTNIHMVLEEAPEADMAAVPAMVGPRVFPVSASSADAVKAAVAGLGDWAAAHSEADADAVAETLRFGRKQFAERAVLVAPDMAGLAAAARDFSAKPVTAGRRDRIAFLFPGQGAQHVGMARELFAAEPVFREALSLCARILEPELGLNLLDVIHAPEDQAEAMTERLKNTALAQPAIFSIGYALAKQWDHWGITPDVMVGHSIGEFAAATVAGVIELTDALKLISLRGRLMADLPRGVMVSVRASEEELLPYLGAGLDLAAVNGAKACVIAGPEDAAAALLPVLEAAGFVTSTLHTSHAFHSHMMEPALKPFRAAVARMPLRAPRIPILSTVTGDWLTETEATDPDYWANHMRRPVRFYDAMQVMWAEGAHVFLETGPGRTMSMLAAQNPDRKAAQPAIASLPHAQAEDKDSLRSMLEAFGLLWANGYPVDWARLDPHAGQRRRAVGLPTYPFQKKRFWVEPVDIKAEAVPAQALEAVPDAVTAQSAPQVSAIDALREVLSELSGIEPEEMPGDAGFMELGFDSLLLTQVTRELSERFSVTVTLRQLIDGFDSLDALAAHIEAEGNLGGAAPADRTPNAEMTRIETETTEATPSSAPMTKISREAEELTPAQRAHIETLTARFTAKTAKSKALTTHYRPYHADPRTASGFNRLWKEIVYQIVTVKSKGSRLIDVDGNEYIDILNGFGPGFLGHSPDAVVKAVEDQLHAGFEVGPQSLAAMEAAQLFCEVTGNDRASFVCTGSEAVYAAMRLARTVTSRDKIVMFARDYHGNFDEVLVRGIDGKDGPRTLPLAPGIPRDAVKNVVVLPYGSPQALDYIRKNADSLAAVIVEPVQSRRPEFRPAEFIREVRRITEKSGSLFIFDEVVTGFRFGPRGAQGYYGVKADLITYGKVVGGGMPVGVVSGQARYMDTFDGGMWDYGDDSFPNAPVTFFAGTFVRHPLAMASLKAMLTFFRAQPDFFWKTVNAKGDKLAGTVDKWFADNDMPFQMPNCGSLMYLRIGEDQKFGPLIGAHMRDRGVFLLEGFPSYMTAAHDDADIDHVIEAFKDSALEMRAAGMLTGREPVAYPGPKIAQVVPRLSLPDGAARIAAAMAAPLGTLSVPTTEPQREIWAAMVVTPEVSAAYNESVTLKLHGPVDRDGLRAAALAAFQRHDALRSTFSADGMLMHVHPDLEIDVPLVDLTAQDAGQQAAALERILADEVETPFDMENGPFVRAHLVALSDAEHHLIVTAHHMVCDGWSIDVIMRDIGRIYTATTEGQVPVLPPAHSIIDYARAEAEWARSGDYEVDRDHWLGRFAGEVPVLDLPTDRPRAPVRTVAARRIDAGFDPALVARLRKTAAAQGSTMVNLLLAGFELYLARITGASDVTVAVPAAGQASRGMEQLVGHCVNLMPLRTHVDRSAPFADYLRQMRGVMLDGSERQHFSFGTLVRELRMDRDPSRIPITPVMFNIDNGIDLSDMRFGAAATEFVSNPRAFENFEIFLNVTNGKDTVLAEWTYNTGLFDAETIEAHMAGLSDLLERIADNPQAKIGELLALTEAEAAAVVSAAQGTIAGYPDQPLHALVAAQAARTPDGNAVEADGTVTSYAALDALSNRIANELIARGVMPGDRVGVAVARGMRTVAAMLGVMKTGAAYLPLDPAFPHDRLAYMVADSGAVHAIVDASTRDLLETVQRLDLDADALGGDESAPTVTVDPGRLAYVLYTSGSTGKPKGVAIPHRAFVNFITAMAIEPGLKPGDRLLAVTTISFDIAGLEIWGPLTTGGTVVMAGRGDAVDAGRLMELLAGADIDVMQATPSTWRMLVDAGWQGSRDLTALVGGEALPINLARDLMARCGAVWNMYGPTETTVWSTVKRLDGGRLTIGHPIANTEIAILDDAMRAVPPGVPGELYIGGDGLAEGYLGQPELTAERFARHPSKPGVRLYRTGDLARWIRSANGFEIDCLGRIDNQIKLRGYRIELEEIEAALADHPDLRQAVALVRDIAPGDSRLVAYVVAETDSAPDAKALRAHLGARLPDYMVPSRFETLATMPLTPNGKIDRKALAARPLDSAAGVASAESGRVAQLLGLFREVLDQSDVSADDSFFELGGHSLLAVKLFARLREVFGTELPISTLFSHPTARRLADQIGDAPRTVGALPETAGSDQVESGPMRNRTEAPTTEGQREIFGAILFDPDQSLTYNLPFSMQIDGPLDTDAMRAALGDLVERHDALRARFDDSGMQMTFAAASGTEIALLDLSGATSDAQTRELHRLRSASIQTRFDLAEGPLFTATLVRLADVRHEIVFATHHIICDGWSVGVMLEDLRALYLARIGQGAALPPAQSIAELAEAEARWSESGGAAADLAFWTAKFAADVPLVDLPTDHTRPRIKTTTGAQLRKSIGPDLTERLRASARRQGATVENMIFAAFNVFVARLTGSQDVVIGMPSAGQLAHGLDRVVGHSVNFLPIRNRVGPDETFGVMLDRVRLNQLEALDHKKITLGTLLRELKLTRDQSRVPLVPVAITFDNVIAASGTEYPGLDARLIWHERPYEHFEIFAYISSRDDHLSMEWSYNADLFDAATIDRHMTHFVQLLGALADDPGRVVGTIPMLSSDERTKLMDDWQGKVVDYPRDKTLAQLFDARVAVAPDATAIVDGDDRLTYARLDQMVNAIARRLIAEGVGAGDRVGVCLDRSARMVAAMLAAMRLGAAYVPLDPSNPADRLAYIAADAQVKCTVTVAQHAERLGLANAVTLDDLGDGEIATAAPVATVAVDPLSAVYVTYTSGSTGAPKGVMGTHRATVNRFAWMWREFPFAEGEVMCQKTAISFGDSVWEIFGPLLAGVPQVVISNEILLDPRRFLETLGAHRVSRLLLVPSLLKTIVAARIDLAATAPSLRMLFTSGERIPVSLARDFLACAPHVTLVNLYGSSEVAADVTCEIVATLDTDEVPIGRAIDNCRLYVLNPARDPVPLGETGELYVGGDGLAAGYFNRPDLTAERFLHDPFSNTHGARMFATGDLVRYLPDGRLMFKGRADHQVKIRGSRVELGEVEVALASLPGVAEAVAVTRVDEDGDNMLLAYVTAKDGAAPDPVSLRDGLARSLPDYMVPTRIRVLDRMPLNPNGKTDRPALAAMAAGPMAADRGGAPATAAEKDMLDIWSRLLGTTDIGPDDDFFVLGGHSLMAVKLFTRIRRKFGVDLPISTLLAYPTARGLAGRVSALSAAPPAQVQGHSGAPEDSPWDTTAVINPGPGNGATPLFIVGGVGGNVNNLVELGQIVGRTRPLIGLQTRGVMGHRMHDTVEAMATDHLVNIRRHQPKGPYLFAGYSGGAFTAYEMARQLEASGEEVGFLGILDMEAPGFEVDLSMSFVDRLRLELEALKKRGIGGFVSRLVPLVRETLVSDRLVRLYGRFNPEAVRLPRLRRHWFDISVRYRPGPYKGDAWFFITEADGFVATMMHKVDPEFGWQRLVLGERRYKTHSADHLDMLTGEAVKELGTELNSEIERAQRKHGFDGHDNGT